MGEALLAALAAAPDFELTAAFCADDDPQIGAAVTAGSPVLLQRASAATLANTDVVIDFTVAAATLALAELCAGLHRPMVIGTTGFLPEEHQRIEQAAAHLALVLAPNMSVGVNLSLALLALAARTLPADYDVEILEMHHRNKVDAPSGTALMMGQVVARARNSTLEAERLAAYQGTTGVRRRGGIGFASMRGGDVVGDHMAVFAGDGERIEITHRSGSRRAYADGALKAARFVVQQAPGLYSMRDVLGLDPL
jgi:4-hydroxy-tetrahydrodipicolinate reductase